MAKTAKAARQKEKESVSKSRSTAVTADSKAAKPKGKAKRGDRRRRTRKREAIENRPVLEPNAAGVDIGAREVYMAVPPDRDKQPVRIFETFTADLQELANWLTACGITTMESTGV